MIGEPGWDAVLRRDRYDEHCTRLQLTTEAEQARAIGVSASYLNRVLAGKRHLNRRFIAGVLGALGCRFEEIFEIIRCRDGLAEVTARATGPAGAGRRAGR